MVSQTGGRRKRRTGKKRRASTKFLAAGNAWRAHVKETMRNNPSMKFGKQLLKLASKTYKQGARTLRDTKYSVQVRPKTSKASKKKRTKRPKRTKRNRKRRSFFGF